MAHFVEERPRAAAPAIMAMQTAALAARQLHARAELMRHMLTTARKVAGKPKAEAVETVVREWMDAWNLGRGEWPHIAREMEAFTAAFHDYANEPGDGNDTALRKACDALDAVLARENTSISDQMAFRSQCAHRWWEMIVPVPADLTDAKPRPSVPPLDAAAPFWQSGCAGFCR